MAHFASKQQIAVTDLGGIHAEEALIAEAPGGQFGDRFRYAVDQADVNIASRAEVALVRIIGAFSNIERVDGLRHQPVEVSIPLAVRVGAHVDRHVVDPDRHVGAVVQVVSAQEVLVGFAFAAVLGHDKSGHCFQDFAGPRNRTPVKVLSGDHHLACHARRRRGSRSDVGRSGTSKISRELRCG